MLAKCSPSSKVIHLRRRYPCSRAELGGPVTLQPSVVPDAPQADPGVCITVVDEATPTIGVPMMRTVQRRSPSLTASNHIVDGEHRSRVISQYV